MNIGKYQVWSRQADTIKELKEEEWSEKSCFSDLKYHSSSKYFQARFNNLYDNFKENGGHSAQEWLEEFPLSPQAMSGIVKIVVEKDYYYVTLDLSILSYQWAFSILTLLRYPGEYYNICWNYWKIRVAFQSLDKWQALYLAHQGTWYIEYREVFNYSFSYNNGHALFKQGQKLSNVNAYNTFTLLDSYDPFLSKNKTVTTIQDIWGKAGYDDYLNFNSNKWRKAPHIDKEIT